MKRKIFVLIIFNFTLFVSLVGIARDRGAKDIVINGGKKGDIPFQHHLHQDTLSDCNVCHSIFPQKKSIIKELKDKGRIKKKEIMDVCKNCHKVKKKAGGKTGPTWWCKSCHTK